MAIFKVTDLQCEYYKDPLGIDIPIPRFSWKIESSSRGACQVSYRIRLAETEADVHQTPLWDTGVIGSKKTTFVTYEGPELKAFCHYFWTVDCVGADGVSAVPDRPASFYTGPLRPASFTGRWIASPYAQSYTSTHDPVVEQRHTEYHAAYLHKEFSCDGEIGHAYVFASAAGIYELWINGDRIGDHRLDPAPTDYDVSRLYSCFDVTGQLSQHNRVVAVLGNGRHLKLYGYGKPEFFCEFHIRYSDGREVVVVTDSSWRVSPGPIRENGIFFGEHVDAALDDPILDSFEEGAGAVEVESPLPRWQAVDPIRATATLHPEEIANPAPGTYVFDFGQNISGVVRLRARGPEGSTVTLRHAELLAEDGGLNVSTNRYAEATDVYTLRGDGPEVFEPRFTYHGFRYAEVTGYPGVPGKDDIEARFVHTDVPRTGSFSCSHPLINRIHRNVIWGQLANLMGIPTDCPQRAERHGWIGDANLSCEEALYNFSMPRFYRKFLQDIAESQEPDGSLSCVVPTYWKIAPADPVWGSGYPSIAWNAYWHFGDHSFIGDHFEGIKRYVDFLHGIADDGIIGNFTRMLFGDWCPPGSILPKRTPIPLTNTWYYYHDTLLTSRIAEILGEKKDADLYRDRAQEICEAFNRRFLTERGYEVIKMGPWDRFSGQTSNLLPLYLDMVPDDRRDEAVECLLENIKEHHDYHLDTGIVGTRYLFDYLTKIGEADTAFKIATRESYPGWGYMLAEGATTLWERWEKLEGAGMNSQNHIMLGSIDAWFYRVLAGISAEDPGWAKIRVHPHCVAGLSHAEASVETVLGTARVSWEKSADVLRCAVSIPPGATGAVVLPGVSRQDRVDENGLALDSAKGIVRYNYEKGRLVVDVESGDYLFKVSST